MLTLLRPSVRMLVQGGRRAYAAAGGQVVHGEHKVDKHDVHHEVSFQPHPPVATYDDLPIPQYPYQQMYDKENSKFNMLLGLAVVTFTLTFGFIYFTDALDLAAGLPPKSYKNRKIYKPTDP